MRPECSKTHHAPKAKKPLIVWAIAPKCRRTQAGFVSNRLVIASARAGGHLHNRGSIGGGRESGSGNPVPEVTSRVAHGPVFFAFEVIAREQCGRGLRWREGSFEHGGRYRAP